MTTFSADNDFAGGYLSWLKKNISQMRIDNVCEITTPFLDCNNDCIQFYVSGSENKFRLSDDGVILSDLSVGGFDLRNEKNIDALRRTANSLGVTIKNNALTLDASGDDLFKKMHMFIQGMIKVSDLFASSVPVYQGLFTDDVKGFLDSHDIRFTDTVDIQGKSGLMHRYDYIIPHHRNEPDKLITAINQLSKDKIASSLFAMEDLLKVRKVPFATYLFLNDQKKPIREELMQAIANTGARAVPWSKKESALEELAA